MSGMLFLLFDRSLFQFGATERKREGYYGEKNYLDMSFWGLLGSEDRGGGDNSIQLINFGRGMTKVLKNGDQK